MAAARFADHLENRQGTWSAVVRAVHARSQADVLEHPIILGSLQGSGIISTAFWNCEKEIENGSPVQLRPIWVIGEMEGYAFLDGARQRKPSARTFVKHLQDTQAKWRTSARLNPLAMIFCAGRESRHCCMQVPTLDRLLDVCRRPAASKPTNRLMATLHIPLSFRPNCGAAQQQTAALSAAQTFKRCKSAVLLRMACSCCGHGDTDGTLRSNKHIKSRVAEPD